MFSIIIFVLLVTGVTVNCEVHSLTYIYTALSKPAGLPGIHEFTAMGLLDNKMIEYFDSETQKKVPKQDWMKERLNKNYWERGTEFLKREQQRLRNQINIFMDRMGQNDSDIHVLQRMHGCKADIQPDGEKKFISGMLMYNYDGNNVWSFNSISGVWVRDEAAGEAKMKWDDVPILNENTEGLERQCLDRLDDFVSYGRWHLKAAPPPEVFMFTQKAKVETNVILTCLATGFYPKDIVLQIKRNGRVLTGEDGVVSSGVRPNGDDTNQQRDHVEILESDESVYTCEVKHNTLGLHVEKQWVRPPDPPNIGLIVGVVVGMMVVVVLILVIPRMFVWLKKRSKRAADRRARDFNANEQPKEPLIVNNGAGHQRAQDANNDETKARLTKNNDDDNSHSQHTSR